jgi:ribonucleoside-diphosphate reductase alpha chain
MVADLKYFDGSLARIDRIPQDLRDIYATAFEVEPSGWWKPPPPPEVDRPGPVAEHLHGRRLGQEAGRHLQAGLAAWPEDHLLPAHHGATHVEKSTVRAVAERGVVGRRRPSGIDAAARLHRRCRKPRARSARCVRAIGFEECEACQ